MIPPDILQHATPRQLEYLEAVEQHGTETKAAAALGVNPRTLSRGLRALEGKGLPRPKKPGNSLKIMVVFDVQAKPGLDFSYLMRMGQYAVDKKPDIIVFIGDFADMESLSSYDKGKKSFEGRRYKRDVEACHWAMSAFHTPIVDYNKAHPNKPYTPRKVMTLGNHEERINRATNDDPKLDGMLSIDDLKYKDFGFEVYPFLERVIIAGVAFSHYFVSGVKGNASTTAAAQLRKANMSCIAGHQQGKQIAYATRADGATITSIICGSCYEHDEDYLGPQGNKHYRGFLMMHEVVDGAFDEMWVSLNYINKTYPKLIAPTPVYSMPTAEEIAAGRI